MILAVLILRIFVTSSLFDVLEAEVASLIKSTGDEDDTECGFPNVYRDLGFLPPPPPSSYPKWVGVPVRAQHQPMFEKAFRLLLQKGLFFNEEKGWDDTSAKYHSPDVLRKIFNFTLNSGFGESEEEMLRSIEYILDYSPKISHSFYLNKSGNGLDPFAVVGDWIGVTANAVTVTYSSAPVGTLFEMAFVKKLLTLVEYPRGEGDGVLAVGPDHANIMAMTVALSWKFPEYKRNGFMGGKVPKFGVIMATSYSIKFEAVRAVTGIPLSSVVFIPVSNSTGRICVDELESTINKAKSKGIIPMMVIASVGSDGFGAIDPIASMADVTQKHGIWLHVDASNGGGILLSEQQKWRIKGIERADSITVGMEKIVSSGASSSFLLVRNLAILEQTFVREADYLFYRTSLYNASYNLGEKSLQTSKRQDIMKIWFAWKSKGTEGISWHIERLYNNTGYIFRQLKNYDKIKILNSEIDTPVISFYYVPLQLQGMDTKSQQYYFKINDFNMKIRGTLLNQSGIYLSNSPHPEKENDFNILTMGVYNSALKEPEMNYIVAQIVGVAEYLEGRTNADGWDTLPHKFLPYKYAASVSAPVKRLHRDFYVEVINFIIRKALFFQEKQCEPPTRYLDPNELERVLNLDLEIEKGLDQPTILGEIEEVVDYTPHMSHPMYMHQVIAGLDPYAMIGDYVASVINSPMSTYEDSPIPSLMEEEVLRATRSLIGYPNGEGDGTIPDGGSMSNALAIGLARYRKTRGEVPEKQMVFFVSEDSHYSFQKGCLALGMGTNNCLTVKCDNKGRMLIPELRAAIKMSIQAGKVPIGVGATAGTTVYGSIDPLEEIANVCEEFDLYFHIDGTYAGTLAWSEKYKYKIKGVERSDSFTTNFHKIFNAPHLASIFVTKEKDVFRKAFGTNDMQAALQDTVGVNPFFRQTHRPNVLKIWFTWKARGAAGLGAHIDYIFDRAHYLLKKVKESPSFEPVLQEFDTVNVCFHYIPPRLQGKEKNTTFWEQIDKVSRELYVILNRKGVMNIVAQNRLGKEPYFLKVPVVSSALTDDNLKFMLRVIEHFGKDL